MKSFFLRLGLACNLLFFSISGYAQISAGGNPVAQQLELDGAVPQVQAPEFDLERIANEDAVDQKQGNYPRIGRFLETNVHPERDGQWDVLPDGAYLWRVAIHAEGAKGMALHFDDFALPGGCELFVYTPDYAHVLGAFTDFNNHPSGSFDTQLLPGEEVIVELRTENIEALDQLFTISQVFHAYRMVPGAEAESNRDFGDSDPCQVNANCSEGNNWQDEKRGVVRIFVVEGQFGGWCSGSLINNTAQDCTPYILTALHCGENATSANMNQWMFYFNYEANGCNNPFSEGNLANQSIGGCSRIADSDDGGGDAGSDFLLVELNNGVPESYQPYYNGWRHTNMTSGSGVSIHHPAGDIKKISTFSSNLLSSSWGSASGSHWQVTWVQTSNGHGVTEGGSSGSPIFDSNGLIIGTLTGGSSFCTSPNFPDYYGKMSYHWNSNPGDNLGDFLDPIGSGANTLTGSDNPCNGGGGGGDDCVAGSISGANSYSLCPGESFSFNATGVEIPAGGGYGLQFTSDGGFGGFQPGFTLGDVTLPFDVDAGLQGILAANDLAPMGGSWLVSGFVYTDPEDFANTLCDETATEISVTFLLASDPDCGGGGGGDEPCTEWVSPTPTTGWSDFNTAFGGAPVNTGNGCPFNEITDFEVWIGEAYALDNVVQGTTYTFSHCNGPGAGSWTPEYTIIAPSEAIDAFGPGTGCSITWTASESGTYFIVINESGECGSEGSVDNGYPAITCEGGVNVEDLSAEFEEWKVFPNPSNGDFSIHSGALEGLTELRIYNLNGQVVLFDQVQLNPQNNIAIQASHLAAGSYVLELSVEGKVYREKLILH